MTISYSWLKDYINTSLSAEEIAAILTATGLEVESVEKIEAVPGGLKGVIVGEVVECEKHPDADRLSLTKVNLGEGEPVQIVCGAPNVAKGQKVLVATIGTKLYPNEGEPFTIKKGKIRGQESFGMICAEDELGLGESHEGIKVLDDAAVPGTAASESLKLSEDYVFEIGLTPNRTDAISHYGVARDLAAALRNMRGITREPAKLTKPSTNNFNEGNESPTISVTVENSEACPRYSSIEIKNLKIAASPKWLQEKLSAIGLRPINNVVDITNYVQHELGQPLHAFDANMIGGNQVVVRLAKEEEKIITLDEAERTLTDEDLVICDAKRPMCIAGVFGGVDSGVSEKTTRVFLESAYFNPVYVRKTARRQALNTDSSFRFERGCDPEMTIVALKRAAQLMVENAGGEVATAVNDIYPNKIEQQKITFHCLKARKLIGRKITDKTIKKILSDLEFEINSERDGGVLELTVPLYRVDVTREADVVEEVLRIYGYDSIKSPNRMQISLQSAKKPDVEALQNTVSDFLTSIGFSEMMSMSLTKSKYRELSDEPEESKETSVELLNPLSSDLAVMRQNLLYSGLEAIAHNRNHKNADLKLYEFGKIYHKFGEKYHEEKRLSLFLTGRRTPESWNNADDAVSFSDLKAMFENLLKSLHVSGGNYNSLDSSAFSDAVNFSFEKNEIARLGSVNSSLLKKFDVGEKVWYAEIFWEKLIAILPKGDVKYREPEKFPSVRRDLSLLIDKSVKYAEIEKLARETEKKLLRSVNLFDVYEGKNIDSGKKSYAVSFTLQDESGTMTDEQSERAMSKIQKVLEEKLGATLRS